MKHLGFLVVVVVAFVGFEEHSKAGSVSTPGPTFANDSIAVRTKSGKATTCRWRERFLCMFPLIVAQKHHSCMGRYVSRIAFCNYARVFPMPRPIMHPCVFSALTQVSQPLASDSLKLILHRR